MKICWNKIYIVWILFFISSCGIKKSVVHELESINVTEIIDKINSNQINSNWLYLKGKIKILSNNDKVSLGVSLKIRKDNNYVVADFICPTPEARSLFPSDYVIWVDTIKEGRFDDTNKMFVKPAKYTFHVTTQDAKNWAPKIYKDIKK